MTIQSLAGRFWSGLALALLLLPAVGLPQSPAEVASDGAYYGTILRNAPDHALAPWPSVFPPPEQGDANPNPVWEGLMSSFALPFEELWEDDDRSLWEQLEDEFDFKPGIGIGLNQGDANPGPGSDSQGVLGGRNLILRGTLRYTPLSNWFASTTFFYYLDEDQQAPWDPDFTYSFGYNDWRPYTLSLVYANYQGNRLNPERDKGEQITHFREGTWTLGYKFPLPDPIRHWVVFREDDTIGCNLGYDLIPQYFDNASQDNRHYKHRLTLGCHYPFTDHWYINGAVYYYPQDGQQQPWDPDYVYSIGYSDWHPGTLSFSYGNYSGNRFPGRERGEDTGRIQDGSFSVNWNWAF